MEGRVIGHRLPIFTFTSTDLDVPQSVTVPQKPFMRYQNGLQALLIKLQPLAPQILPFLVFPILTIVALKLARLTMLSTLFNWSSSRDSSTSREGQDRKKLKKKGVRNRAEQLALLNGDGRAGTFHGFYS